MENYNLTKEQVKEYLKVLGYTEEELEHMLSEQYYKYYKQQLLGGMKAIKTVYPNEDPYEVLMEMNKKQNRNKR